MQKLGKIISLCAWLRMLTKEQYCLSRGIGEKPSPLGEDLGLFLVMFTVIALVFVAFANERRNLRIIKELNHEGHAEKLA